MNKRVFSLCLILCLLILRVSAQTGKSQAKTGVTARIDRLLRAYHDAKLFNGSILVAQRGRVIFKRGYGLANMEWNIPNSPATRFRIGSVTKQFTATLIMQLKQDGKIDLQAKITEYLPWYRKDTGDKITVHHLLTHTSGIPNYTSAENLADISSHNYSGREIAEKYCSDDLEFTPGTQFKYDNSGYFLLGLIIEAIAKKPYAEVLKENIFVPAGVSNSGIDSPVALVANRASGYELSPNGYVNTGYLNMDTSISAAGAIFSTVEDLYLWQEALFGNKLLAPENTRAMLTPNLGNYGYGIYIGKTKSGGRDQTAIGHPGGINGFTALSIRFVEDGVSVILLDNTRSAKRGNPENISAGILTILRGERPEMPKPKP